MKGDTPTHRKTVAEMTDDELDIHLTGIRERRLRAWKVYRESVDAANAVRGDKLTVYVDKQCEMLQKELVRLDKLLEKIDARVLKVRATRLEIEEIAV